MPELNLEKCYVQSEIDTKMQERGNWYIGLLKAQLQLKDESKQGFNGHFHLIALVSAMCEHLEHLSDIKEYTERECENFCEFVNFYILIKREELFVINNDKITDINWQNVKYNLLLKLRDEGYVTLSAEESALLEFLQNKMPSDANMAAMALDANMLDRLIPHGYALAQCLKFFSEWTMEQQATLVLVYLQNKSLNEQKECLTILKKEAPQLTAQLRTQLQQAQSKSNNQMRFFKNSLIIDLTTELVQAIVYGNLEKAEKILKDNPALLDTLLTEKATVEDYSGRTVKQMTAFQAALCAWDNELCEMLGKHMTKEAMEKQYRELFPQGHENYCSTQTSFDFSQIVNAISQSSDADLKKALNFETDTPLWEELEQFRTAFTRHSCQEDVFNPQHLLKAFEFYDSKFERPNEHQPDLFWRQVVGYTQRFLPANIAMDFVQGLYYRVKNNEGAVRSLNFQSGGSILPLSFDSSSGLGFAYAVGERWASPSVVASGATCFSELMSSKKDLIGRMIQLEPEPEPKPRCCVIQ